MLVARQVLVDLVEENLIFVGKDTSLLMQHGRFYTKYVSEIESDPVGVFKLCRDIFDLFPCYLLVSSGTLSEIKAME